MCTGELKNDKWSYIFAVTEEKNWVGSIGQILGNWTIKIINMRKCALYGKSRRIHLFCIFLIKKKGNIVWLFLCSVGKTEKVAMTPAPWISFGCQKLELLRSFFFFKYWCHVLAPIYSQAHRYLVFSFLSVSDTLWVWNPPPQALNTRNGVLIGVKCSVYSLSCRISTSCLHDIVNQRITARVSINIKT